MDGVLEHFLIGGDLLRHVMDSDGKDRQCASRAIDEVFKAGEPAFIDCAQLAMQPGGPVLLGRTCDEKTMTARNVQDSHKTFAGQADDFFVANRTLDISQSRSQVDDVSVLLPEDMEEARQVANERGAALQTLLPGSYHYWLMRRELLKLVEVHPALEDSVSIPFMHEQENKRWACVHTVMQGEKYMAYCTSDKPMPRHPDPCDRALSKRCWEKRMRNWRQELGDV